METARVTSKGQITIPRDIRRQMNIQKGDRILIFKENNRFYFQKSNEFVLSTFQENMKGAAEEAGFKDADDVAAYIKELRKQRVLK